MKISIRFFSAILILLNCQILSQSNTSNIQISNFYNNTEPSISIDPSNSANLFIGTNVSFISNGFHNYAGLFYTTSGVSSWAGSSKNDMTRFDPSVAYNTNGGLYYAYVETNTTHSPADEILYVMSSTDHGASWNPQTQVSSNNKYADKSYIAIDHNSNSPFKDYIYTSWTYIPPDNNTTYFARSTDGGGHFTPSPINVAVSGGTEASNIAVGPEGNVYVIWSIGTPNCTGIGFNKSTDGGSTFMYNSQNPPPSISSVNEIGSWKNPDYCLKSTTNNPYGVRVNSFPAMAVDPIMEQYTLPGQTIGMEILIYYLLNLQTRGRHGWGKIILGLIREGSLSGLIMMLLAMEKINGFRI